MRLFVVRFLPVLTLMFTLWAYPQLVQAWGMPTLPMPGCSCISVDGSGCNLDDTSMVSYCCHLCVGAPVVPASAAVGEFPSLNLISRSSLPMETGWSFGPEPFPPKADIPA